MGKKNKNTEYLHGNKAKIDPQKHPESLYLHSATVTEGFPQPLAEEMIEEAKDFVDENEK